jgi:hypothetical protein
MTVNQAMDSFHAEIHEPIRAAKKTPVVWEEAVRVFPSSRLRRVPSRLTSTGDRVRGHV